MKILIQILFYESLTCFTGHILIFFFSLLLFEVFFFPLLWKSLIPMYPLLVLSWLQDNCQLMDPLSQLCCLS